MRGGFIHNQILVAPIEAALRALGALTQREYPVEVSSGYHGYVDLFAVLDGKRIVCEAEQTDDRIRTDIAKAAALKADLLLIIMPSHRVAREVERMLSRLATSSVRICCLTLGGAIQQLGNKRLFMTQMNVSRHQCNKCSAEFREQTFTRETPK
jgi:hypothetical protein